MEDLNKQFINWYEGINQNRHLGKYSPHKPLTLLYALANVLKGKRYISYNEDNEELKKIIKFFTNRRTVNPLDPLYRLYSNDSSEINVWTAIPGNLYRDNSGNVSVTEARERDLKCGFSEEYYDWLSQNKGYCQFLINQIMQDNFSDTLHGHILDFLGIFELPSELASPNQLEHTINVQRRDPNFKYKIRELFDNHCAFCGVKIYLDQEILFLEAAHIRAKQNGGPCSEDNGLLLCPTHHYTFDRGLWSLDADYKIVISDKARLKEKKVSLFKKFEGESIIEYLIDETLLPNESFVTWHREYILK